MTTPPDFTTEATGATEEAAQGDSKPYMPFGVYMEDEDTLLVSRTMARAYGLNESIILRQIHYWLKQFAKTKKMSHFQDGHWWVFNSYNQWREDNFDFWSWNTIQRTLAALEELGIVRSSNKYNRRAGDQTKWYTIDYAMHEAFMRLWTLHLSPTSGNGRKSAAYASFMMDWNDQRQDETILASWVDQFSKLHRPLSQVAKAVTRDYTETTTKTKIAAADAAADRLGKKASSDKGETTPRQPDLIFDAVSLHIFGLKDSASVKGQAAGGRIGKINAWLKKNHPAATPEDLKRFADWCKSERFNPPKDLAKFADNFAVFVQNKGLMATSQGQSSTTGPRYGDRDAEGVCVWARIPGVGDGWMYVGKAE